VRRVSIDGGEYILECFWLVYSETAWSFDVGGYAEEGSCLEADMETDTLIGLMSCM
jgi:hypothetical protein